MKGSSKGISTVIAVIMIVVIAVALVGILWAWSTTMVTGMQAGGSQQAQQLQQSAGKQVIIINSKCTNVSNVNAINFTLKNIGTVDIEPGDLQAFLDGEDITTKTTPSLSAVGIKTGETKNINYQTAPGDTKVRRTLRIAGPLGAVEEGLTCS